MRSTTDGIGAPPEASLDAAFAALRLDGAIFFRSEFSEAWSYESPPATADLASQLRPRAHRLIIFHIVARGSCWISLLDDARHQATAGDVIVLPYGDPHRMGGREPAPCVPIFSLLDPPPWDALPVLRHGEGGGRTDIVCGYLSRTIPCSIRRCGLCRRCSSCIRPRDRPRGGSARASSTPSSCRRRRHRAPTRRRADAPSGVAADRGTPSASRYRARECARLSALHDPVLAPAIARLHTEPERKWTVTELAASASVSRSLLDERFRKVLGRAPIRYLTDWRMHIAGDLLRGTAEPVARIARRVGYDSDEAFSRAFKRSHGEAPSVWRTHRVPDGEPDADDA